MVTSKMGFVFRRSGFDGTSNVLAGKKYGIPCKGTQAHAFVSSFLDSDEDRVSKLKLVGSDNEARPFFPIAKEWLEKLAHVLEVPIDQTSRSELLAFCAFAVAFPTNFLALVDTYNVLRFVIIFKFYLNFMYDKLPPFVMFLSPASKFTSFCFIKH